MRAVTPFHFSRRHSRMTVKTLMLAVAAVALMASPAGAAVTIVNNPALFGGTLETGPRIGTGYRVSAHLPYSAV